MTWGVSTARRRPGDLLTRGDVCHLHADRDGAERCGAAAPGAPDLVRLEQYSERGVPGAVVPVGHVGRRAAAPDGRAGASGAVGRAAADRGGGAGRGHDPGRGGCARRRYRPAAAPGRGPVMTAPRPGPRGPGRGRSRTWAAARSHNPRLSDSRRGGPTPEMAMPADDQG